MKTIHQSEAAECGLACMAMIANHHGHKFDLNSLRQQYGISMKGATLSGLIQIADGLSFSSRALRVEIDNLRDLQLPAILHWNMSHFVVLGEVSKNRAKVFDPARGEIKLSFEEVSNHFTGIALEVTPTADFKPIEARQTIKFTSLWTKITGLKRSFLQIFTLSILLQVFVLASPFYLQLIVDEAIVRVDQGLILVLALGFGFLYVMNGISQLLRAWLILIIGQSMTYQMAGNVLRHLLRLPGAFFEKRHVGDVISRMNAIQPIKTSITESIVAAIIDGLMAITTFILMLVYSWKLAVAAIALTSVYLIYTLIIFPIMRTRQQALIEKQAKEQSHIIESIRASRAVKLFGREAERESAWRNLYSEVVNSSVSFGKFNITNEFISGLFSNLQIIVIVYLGALSVIADDMTVGMLFAFMAYRQNFSDRTTALVNKGIEFRMLELHLERLSDIIQTQQEEGLDAPSIESQTIKGDIEFNNVSFRYAPTEPFIFENLTFQINRGDFVAIIGSSGGGKTTLLKVMLGVLKPEDGKVLIDKEQLQIFGLRRFRKNIGVVMQDDQLLSGTITDNISFFDSEVNIERVHECAKIAQIHADIERMPMKYLSLIGDMGSALSGGQRQRLLLARALYQNPKILFLDEGTANLDENSEKHIAEVISQMPITRIVIAHRPALIHKANRIFTLVGSQLQELPLIKTEEQDNLQGDNGKPVRRFFDPAE